MLQTCRLWNQKTIFKVNLSLQHIGNYKLASKIHRKHVCIHSTNVKYACSQHMHTHIYTHTHIIHIYIYTYIYIVHVFVCMYKCNGFVEPSCGSQTYFMLIHVFQHHRGLDYFLLKFLICCIKRKKIRHYFAKPQSLVLLNPF